MIQLQNISYHIKNRALFENADLTLFAGQKVGVIGANGVGKSTLLALIKGKVEVDSGAVDIAGDLVIAEVEQEVKGTEQIALDYVMDGDQELRKIQQKIAECEQQEDWIKLADYYSQLEHVDGYSASARAAQLLSGLGFSDDEHFLAIGRFSGGWRMRLNLARAIFTRSDVLMLDEPTNHLDLEAILWLENRLKYYQGVLIIISHDSDFLDAIVSAIVHVENKQFKLYTSNYSGFLKLRAEQLELQQRLYEKQQRTKDHLTSFISRFRAKATKARQVQSRMKALERMQQVAAVYSSSSFQFQFQISQPGGSPLLNCQKLTAGYEEHVVLDKINLSIYPFSRIGLIGPNGAGKTTLLETLAGKIDPINGAIIKDTKLKIGYFSQHQVDELALDVSPLVLMQRMDGKLVESQCRNFLGGFGFAGDRVFEPVGNFSGGEKVRLALALLVWQAPNCLLLDEPTNHLDMEMKEALMLALQSFEGAIVVVSHDRHFLKATVDELLMVNKGDVKSYEGDVESYCQELRTLANG